MNRSRGLVLLGILVFGIQLSAVGGERGPGKYSGVVVFDRWDSCTLYGGISVMYVSKSIKETLRPYAGQCIQIDASEVFQPRNPGDGLINSCRYLGPATKEHKRWVKLDGLRLISRVHAGDDQKPVARITIANTGKDSVEILPGELALTLLTQGKPDEWTPYDDASMALITRQSFLIGSEEPRWKGRHWTIGEENALSTRFELAAGTKKHIDIHFDLPGGEYEYDSNASWRT